MSTNSSSSSGSNSGRTGSSSTSSSNSSIGTITFRGHSAPSWSKNSHWSAKDRVTIMRFCRLFKITSLADCQDHLDTLMDMLDIPDNLPRAFIRQIKYRAERTINYYIGSTGPFRKHKALYRKENPPRWVYARFTSRWLSESWDGKTERPGEIAGDDASTSPAPTSPTPSSLASVQSLTGPGLDLPAPNHTQALGAAPIATPFPSYITFYNNCGTGNGTGTHLQDQAFPQYHQRADRESEHPQILASPFKDASKCQNFTRRLPLQRRLPVASQQRSTATSASSSRSSSAADKAEAVVGLANEAIKMRLEAQRSSFIGCLHRALGSREERRHWVLAAATQGKALEKHIDAVQEGMGFLTSRWDKLWNRIGRMEMKED